MALRFHLSLPSPRTSRIPLAVLSSCGSALSSLERAPELMPRTPAVSAIPQLQAAKRSRSSRAPVQNLSFPGLILPRVPGRIARSESDGTNVGGSTSRLACTAMARRRRWRATSLFLACERRSKACAVTPVGRCFSLTPLSVLFRCCPPGPDERRVSTSHSQRSSLSLSSKESLAISFTGTPSRRRTAGARLTLWPLRAR